jgi:arabinose-5-phosphate isomerase
MLPENKKLDLLEHGRRVIEIERENLENLAARLGDTFICAVRQICESSGKVIITGIGKSGIIGRKIAATLASIGTPSLFLHPGEAVHGDLGMVSKNDTVIIISNSGETEEIIRIMPSIKKIGARIISFTCSESSCIGSQSDIAIATGKIEEADSFGIIPTSSTTCALVLGDALALALMAAKGIQKEEFAFYHPGGNLGKRLMLKVRDVMQTGELIPIVGMDSSLREAIEEINSKNTGLTLVADGRGVVRGILTDGDIRRHLHNNPDITKSLTRDCMTGNPMTIDENSLAIKALSMMEEKEITCLVILNSDKTARGIVHLHDLLGKKDFKAEY